MEVETDPAVEVQEEFPAPEEPFTTLATDILPHQLDCIVWNHKHDIFVFGTYELDADDNNSQIRHGKIYMAVLDPEVATGYKVLQEVNDLPGILDLKWEPIEEKRLAAATSTQVLIYKLETLDGKLCLTKTHSKICEESSLALYIQWMNSTDLVFSDSKGYLKIWTISPAEDRPANELFELQSTHAHEFFVWYVHYDPESEVFYSGDDDGMLVACHKSNFENNPLHMKKKFRTGGVTAINTRDDLLTVGW
jgi:WD40 repeat protein